MMVATRMSTNERMMVCLFDIFSSFVSRETD